MKLIKISDETFINPAFVTGLDIDIDVRSQAGEPRRMVTVECVGGSVFNVYRGLIEDEAKVLLEHLADRLNQFYEQEATS